MLQASGDRIRERFPWTAATTVVDGTVDRTGHAEENMTSFRVTATIHSHVDSVCRKDERVSDESHLSRVPRTQSVTEVNQEDCPTREPNTGIELPPVECTRVDEGELVHITPITPITTDNRPIPPKPSDRRLTVNGTLSAISGKGNVGDNEPVTPRRLYSTVLQTP